jgi:hypothetical protein
MGHWEQIAADRMRREKALAGAPWWRRLDWTGIVMIAGSVMIYGLLAFAIGKLIGIG